MKGVSQYNVYSRKGISVRTLISAWAIVPILMFYAAASSPVFAAGGSSRGSVSVTADEGHAPAGSVVNYTVTVVNGSQAGLYTLTDNLPSDTTLVAAPWNCTEAHGHMSCDLALFPSDVVVIEFTVQVNPDARCGATLRNTARVRSWPSATVETEVFCP